MEDEHLKNLETRRYQWTASKVVKVISIIALVGPVVVLAGLVLAGVIWGLVMALISYLIS